MVSNFSESKSYSNKSDQVSNEMDTISFSNKPAIHLRKFAH